MGAPGSPNSTFYNSWALWGHQTLFVKQCVLESLHRETKRNRYICPCTRIRIYVFADERALCRAPFSFWPAFSFCSASMVPVITFVLLRWPEGTSADHA